MTTPADQLDAMRRLPENWDGYGAAPVADEIIDFAQELVGFVEAALNRGGANAPGIHVSPTRVGGVLVEWDDAAMEHEVQIDPDFCLSFLV
jgi:hypothetical protein